MELGRFSVSLAVRDLAASRAFYAALGFEVLAGEDEAGWLVMSGSGALVGLFEGMFERNLLTFNPGRGPDGEELSDFEDVRALEDRLREAGLEITSSTTGERAEGPAHLVLVDPDGNPVLIDQHR